MAKVGRTYKLAWADDHPLMPGAVVKIRGLSIRRFLEVQRLAQRFQDVQAAKGADGVELVGQALTAVEELAGIVGKALVSWNLEDDDDQPIPADTDGAAGLDPEQFTELIEQWLDAVAGVPAPLAGTSSDGPSPEELSMPMELLSASPAN